MDRYAVATATGLIPCQWLVGTKRASMIQDVVAMGGEFSAS